MYFSHTISNCCLYHLVPVPAGGQALLAVLTITWFRSFHHHRPFPLPSHDLDSRVSDTLGGNTCGLMQPSSTDSSSIAALHNDDCRGSDLLYRNLDGDASVTVIIVPFVIPPLADIG